MNSSSDPAAAVRDGAARALGAAGLAGIGLIHLLDLAGKFSETPYLAWMYIGLIASAIVVAAELVRTGAARAWAAAGLLAAGAIVGYTLTRTTGLPQAHGDVGNWLEPLGLASLFVEGLVVLLSGAAVAALGRARVAVPAVGPRGSAAPA